MELEVYMSTLTQQERGQRLAVLVDVQNMYYSTKNVYGGKLNFSILLDHIAKKRQLIRSICYVLQSPDTDQTGFHTLLRSVGFEVKVKKLRMRSDGSVHGSWDMGIAIDALSLSSRMDTIAIVTGDGDYTELVEVLINKGVRVEVYCFPHVASIELQQAATAFYPLGEDVVILDNQ